MDGWIDEIDPEGFIKGWAFEKPGHASVLTMKHAGRTLSTISADLYRPDLAREGIGSGHHAFCVPLPPVEGAFDPLLLEICFANGQPLNVGYSFDVWRNIDLLESSYTQYVNFELTTRCNLRCLYCAVSHPDYVGKDFWISDFDKIIAQLKARHVDKINVNGHGETTFIPDWQQKVSALLMAGFKLTMITNLARLLDDDELAVMAQLAHITVSIDTHDARLLREIRRHVKLENILENMRKIQSKADALGIPKPHFSWSCVVSNKVALQIADFVRFGIDHGVKHYVFCNMVEYPGIPGTSDLKHFLALPQPDVLRVHAAFEEAKAMIQKVEGSIDIAGDLEELMAAVVLGKTA